MIIHKKIIIGIFLMLGFFGGSLFAQSGVPGEDPNTELTVFGAGDTPFNPTAGSTQIISSGVCQNIFGQFYDQVKNDVKEQANKCCYQGSKDITPQPANINSWIIDGSSKAKFNSNIPIEVEICDAGLYTNTCRFENKDIPSTAAFPEGLVFGDCKINSCGTGAQYIEKRVSTDRGDIVMCEKCDMEKCNCGVKLNTNVPFIGRCIMYENTNDIGANGDETTTVNPLNAFPVLMGALVKILMSVIMVICFASLIIGGFMMTVPDQYDTGKGIIKKVIWTIVGLGSLGTILYLINPNFFS